MLKLSDGIFQNLVCFNPFIQRRINRLIALIVFMPLVAITVLGQTIPEKMTNKKLQQILTSESTKITGQTGNWQAVYKGIPVVVITDTAANRMRIIAPIIDEKKLTSAELKKLLEANFDTALDAKYALYRGVLWSTFAHPLGNLSTVEFKDALKQVYNLLRTYGTTYSSTNFVFGQEKKEQIQ